MATQQEADQALIDAKVVLLKRITNYLGQGTVSPIHVARYAAAYRSLDGGDQPSMDLGQDS
jgi:hypothetical protein